jgi:hypothetical protein
MPPWLDRALALLFVMAMGFVFIYISRRFDASYRAQYEREFRENPGRRMGWDVLWALVTRRSPIVIAFWGPLGGWLLVALSVVGLADLALRHW